MCLVLPQGCRMLGAVQRGLYLIGSDRLQLSHPVQNKGTSKLRTAVTIDVVAVAVPHHSTMLATFGCQSAACSMWTFSG
jgi:hypothetical protein